MIFRNLRGNIDFYEIVRKSWVLFETLHEKLLIIWEKFLKTFNQKQERTKGIEKIFKIFKKIRSVEGTGKNFSNKVSTYFAGNFL